MSIEAVKQISIIDVAKQLGIDVKDNKALCFNGHDTTPSLSFNVKDNYFKCFGCNIKGSTIDLVKECLNISVKDSIKWLENKYNISPQYKKGDYTKHENKTPYRANGAVSNGIKKTPCQNNKTFSEIYRYFIDLLEDKEAIEYLEKRGINKEIIKKAEIKSIPENNTEIKKKLHNKYGLNKLKECGLVSISKQDKPFFVFFNHRLIIPYKNKNGNIINLQGRNIDNDKEPKYRFLPQKEIPLYNIQILNTLNKQEHLYLCEGAIDVLSSYQLGLKNPIGIAGVNNFKKEYFEKLEPYKVIIASDTDHAGRKFYLNTKKEFLKLGKEIFILNYDKLKDDYNISEETNDLNDIAKKADYIYYKSLTIEPNRYFSPILNETYIEKNGEVIFNSGVKYSKQEIGSIDPEEIKTIHLTKLINKHFVG